MTNLFRQLGSKWVYQNLIEELEPSAGPYARSGVRVPHAPAMSSAATPDSACALDESSPGPRAGCHPQLCGVARGMGDIAAQV
jgi:hypothetical protein